MTCYRGFTRGLAVRPDNRANPAKLSAAQDRLVVQHWANLNFFVVVVAKHLAGRTDGERPCLVGAHRHSAVAPGGYVPHEVVNAPGSSLSQASGTNLLNQCCTCKEQAAASRASPRMRVTMLERGGHFCCACFLRINPAFDALLWAREKP